VRKGVTNIYPEKFPIKRINKKGNASLLTRWPALKNYPFSEYPVMLEKQKGNI